MLRLQLYGLAIDLTKQNIRSWWSFSARSTASKMAGQSMAPDETTQPFGDQAETNRNPKALRIKTPHGGRGERSIV